MVDADRHFPQCFSQSWLVGFPVKVTAREVAGTGKTSTETLDDDVDASGSFHHEFIFRLVSSRGKKDGLRGDARTSHLCGAAAKR